MRKLLDSPWFYFGLAGILAVVAIASQFRYDVPPKPRGAPADLRSLAGREDLNVVFILIDTLHAKRLSAYGYERPTSPSLDALAASGFLFENNEAQSSWTKASMASLWLSLYPEKTGIQRYNDVIPQAAVLPAETLKEAGFRTVALYRNGWLAPNFGFSQGFDTYLKPKPSLNIGSHRRNNPSVHPLQGTDIDLTDSAIEFLSAYHEERFFLYVHYMDVHQYAYDKESDLFGTEYTDAYDNAIHWTDKNVGLLVDALRTFALLDNTLIIVASDHGEAFLEHEAEGHAKNLYTEVQHTPLIIVPPFDMEKPVRVSSRTANVDIWPTVFDLLGQPVENFVEGRSLVPQMIAAGEGRPDPGDPERVLFSQLDRWWGKPSRLSAPMIAAVQGPYRYHYRTGPPAYGELYDHRSDPREAQNLARREPEEMARMHGIVEGFLAEEFEAPWGETEEVELDAMMLNQLRALGYAIEPTKPR